MPVQVNVKARQPDRNRLYDEGSWIVERLYGNLGQCQQIVATTEHLLGRKVVRHSQPNPANHAFCQEHALDEAMATARCINRKVSRLCVVHQCQPATG